MQPKFDEISLLKSKSRKNHQNIWDLHPIKYFHRKPTGMVVNRCKEDITNSTQISEISLSPIDTYKIELHTEKKSPRHRHILTIKYFIFSSLYNMSVGIMEWYTYSEKMYNQKISPGIHLFQLFFFIRITMRCYHNNRSKRQKKLLHLSFIFAMFAEIT